MDNFPIEVVIWKVPQPSNWYVKYRQDCYQGTKTPRVDSCGRGRGVRGSILFPRERIATLAPAPSPDFFSHKCIIVFDYSLISYITSCSARSRLALFFRVCSSNTSSSLFSFLARSQASFLLRNTE